MRDHRPARLAPGADRQRGSVAVLLTIAMLALLAIAGLVLDGGHLMLNKTRLQNAVDAAALSGARTMAEVMGSSGAASTSRDAALQTMMLNANAPGNQELADAIADSGGGFAVVEFSSSVYGPFSYPGPVDARYVRVTVPRYALTGFFWRLLQSLDPDDPLGEKRVLARAVAGPSPTAPCDITPIMVCGVADDYNPEAGRFWGYQFGDLEVLKTAAGDTSPIGPGNFQLIRLDGASGAADARTGLAGGIEQCNTVGNAVETEPGNKVGPAIQGINTRLGEYSGPISPGDYPPDLVIDYSHIGANAMEYDDSVDPAIVTYQGSEVTSAGGSLSTLSGQELYDYNDWHADSAACAAGQGANCQSDGVFERRVIKIVVGSCSGTDAGQTSVPVLGFGCFYLLQPAEQKGNEAQIFGQFVNECYADGYPGPTPSDDAGPNIIQLYKAYINGVGSPSPDS